MKRLTDPRLAELNRYLETSGLSSTLKPELLDHLACEAEERLWAGKSFEEVIESLLREVDADVLLDLSLEHKHLLARNESLNDIVFENRNKLYGAYALRRDYGGNVQRAMIIGVGIFLMMFLLPELYARLKTTDEKDVAFMVEAKPIKITPEKVTPITPPVVETPPPTVKTMRFISYEVLPDEQVPIEMPPPTIEMLADAQAGQENAEDDALADLTIVPPTETVKSGKGEVIGVRPKEEETLLFAEQQPEFFGGKEAFAKFLQKNLRYPNNAARAGVQGRVFVEFNVGIDGKIEQAKTIKGIGFGCDEEALRVVNLMPNWMPGKQSGRPVRVRFTLPIAFQLQ